MPRVLLHALRCSSATTTTPDPARTRKYATTRSSPPDADDWKYENMTLIREQLHQRIDDLHLDDLDLIITRDGDGFAVEESRSGSYVSDIGSSYEVPDTADGHGQHAFTAGPSPATSTTPRTRRRTARTT